MGHFLVGSTFSDRQLGGLTTLMVEVMRAGADHHWTWLVRRDEEGSGVTSFERSSGEHRRASEHAEIRSLDHPAVATPVLRHGLRAALRPYGHITGPAIMRTAYGRSLRRQWPSEHVDGVLWLGTGLELLSFMVRDAAQAAQVPFVVLPALHPGQWGDAAIDIRLYGSAGSVLCLSHDEARHLSDRGVPAESLAVLPVGPTAQTGGDGADWRRRHDTNGPLVAFLGRRTQAKGLDVVVQAHQLLLRAGQKCTLVVAGPPGDVDLPPALPGIIDLGVCSAREKADLMDACDILAMPSRSESFGLVYLDAWSYGKPVVGGPAPAVRELITDGEDGWCVEQDPRAVAEVLSTVFADPELGRRVGAAGKRRQASVFTWSRSLEVLLDAWALDARGSRTSKP